MSRMGRRAIAVPDKAKLSLNNGVFLAEGPLGKQQVTIDPLVKVTIGDKEITVEATEKTTDANRVHGLIRSLVNNAVVGVSTGFKKELDINGVGYRADVKGNVLNLNLGYSHPIAYNIPEGIKVAVEKQTHLVVSGSSKELVGRVAAEIREFRPPEPYKGKGVKYTDEVIVRKVGKAAGGK